MVIITHHIRHTRCTYTVFNYPRTSRLVERLLAFSLSGYYEAPFTWYNLLSNQLSNRLYRVYSRLSNRLYNAIWQPCWTNSGCSFGCIV